MPLDLTATETRLTAPIGVEFMHRLFCTTDAFDLANETLIDAIADGAPDAEAERRARPGLLVVIDEGVARAWPALVDSIRTYATHHDARLPELREILVVTGGEAVKNHDADVERVWRAIDDHHVCRRSTVLAIGGGAMLDAVGYAAATAHRGVRLVRMPTTVLAQDDAAIGVKNGINRFGKKNFVGTFAPPVAVVNDERFLETLDDREWCAGFSEAVKIALLKDPDFLDVIERDAERIRAREMDAARPVIRRCAELHLAHIAEGGDPFETQIARPLDFGHWSAHKLESLTNFDLSHGEAVAIGIAIDCRYAEAVGLAAPGLAARVESILRALGLPVTHPLLDRPEALVAGLEEFREHLGGELTITLVRAPGDPVDVHEMHAAAIATATTTS